MTVWTCRARLLQVSLEDAPLDPPLDHTKTDSEMAKAEQASRRRPTGEPRSRNTMFFLGFHESNIDVEAHILTIQDLPKTTLPNTQAHA